MILECCVLFLAQGTQSRSGSSLASAVAGIAGRVSSVSERQYNGTLLRTPTANVGEGMCFGSAVIYDDLFCVQRQTA